MARGGQAVNGSRPVKARAFVAAATRINLRDRIEAKRQGAKPQGWQADAWDAFDDVPEIKESVWRLGNQMAKLRIYPAIVVNDEVVPVDDPLSGVPPEVAAAATEELSRLKSLRGGQADILRKLEQNFIVVGECYVVGFAATTETRVNTLGVTETVQVPEDWQVRSTDEVQNKDGVYTVKDPDQGEGQGRLLTDRDDIIRVWLEHPRFQVYADSLLRPLVVDARTVTSLTQQMYAESLSKHSAGAFLLPNELSFGPDDETEDEGGENAARDVFLEEFEASLLDPIDDPMSAAVVQPMLIRGPAELLDKVRWIPFGRETDAAIDDRINGRVERIARGLPEPVEKVMGHQQTTFANAAQVDADEFEDYLAPQADILMDALTYAYLRPQLADNPVTADWADRLVIGYDPAKLIANPNPADSADYGLEKGLISGEVWRRVNGYDEEDAPDALELLVSAGLRRGILTADLTKALLDLLGEPIDVQPLPQAPPAGGTPPPAPAPGAALRRVLELMAAATPTLELPGDAPPRPQDGTSPGPGGSASPPQGGKHRPVRGSDAGAQLAAIDRDLLARLTVAANDAMTRALERVGNQLRTKASANRALLLQVPRIEAARTLGPTLTAQALGETDPFAGAWDDLERQFMAWGANAQSQALHIAGEVASGIDAGSRDLLQLRQADDLAGAWSWLKERMSTLGGERLFSPNPLDPGIGEFDPTSKVPTGMLREAIARAGGAQGMAPAHDPALPGGSSSGGAWVALRNIDGTPSGGIGTGETLREGMLDGGAGIEGYRWVYGPAMRARPFEPHVELDGVEFVNFDDDVLAVTGSFPDTGFYFPGDHSGCICDFEPIILTSDELGTGPSPQPEAEPSPGGTLGNLGMPNIPGTWTAPGSLEEAQAFASSAWEGTFGEYTTTVAAGEWRSGGKVPFGTMNVRGKVLDREGNEVGSFVRTVVDDRRKDPNAKPFVTHEELVLDKSIQGQGFASEFNASAEQEYARRGIESIKLHANIDVGGYAWARQGYEWDASAGFDQLERMAFSVSRALESGETGAFPGGIPNSVKAEAESIIERLRAARGLDSWDDVPSPFEISKLGEGTTATRERGFHLGKRAMLGSDWAGVRKVVV